VGFFYVLKAQNWIPVGKMFGNWRKIGTSVGIYFSLSQFSHAMSKKNSNNALLLVAAVVVGFYLWTSAGTLNNLQFVPKGIGVQGAGFSLVLGVQNPTSNALKFSSLAASLNVNGSPVGNVSDFTPVTIAPNSETDITLMVIPNVFGVASGIINLADGNEGSGNFQSALVGTANVNGAALPVNIPFS
jgi:hypothetical protein